MSLWSALLSNSKSEIPMTIDPSFLKIGLLKCTDTKVRECFSKTFKAISKAQPGLNAQILSILRNLLADISEYEKTSEYFALFDSIFTQYLKNNTEMDPIEEHIVAIIKTLKSHKSKETRQSIFADTTMHGLFQLFGAILSCFKE